MKITEFKVLYGGAKVPFHLRNEEQEKIASQEKLARAKERAFSRGLPIIWGKNGKVVAEYANGDTFLIINGEISNILYAD